MRIWASDFELIRNTLFRQHSRDTRDAPLLDTWYTLDEYAVPPVYVLQTVDQVKPRPPSSVQACHDIECVDLAYNVVAQFHDFII